MSEGDMLAPVTTAPRVRRQKAAPAAPPPVDPLLDVAEPPEPELPPADCVTIVHHEKPRDYRCTCGRLLFRARLTPGAYVEGRCPRCGRVKAFEGSSSEIAEGV